MESSLELRKSSIHQHNSKAGKDRLLLPQSKRNPCSTVPQKLKVKCSDRSTSDLYSSSRKEREFSQGEISSQIKRMGAKGITIGEDELVRHMSHLPGYLLHPERGDNLQGKALNVGVLDWSRLESWKHKQIHGPVKGKDDTLGSYSRGHLPTIPRAVRTEKSAKPHASLRSGLIISPQEERSPSVTSVRNAVRSQDSDSGSMSAIKAQGKTQRSCTSSRRNNSNMVHERERIKPSDRRVSSEMVNFSSHLRQSGALPSSKKSARILDGKASNRTEKKIETNIQNIETDERIIFEVGQMPAKPSYEAPLCLNDQINVENNRTKKRVGKQSSDIDLPRQSSSYNQYLNLASVETQRDWEEEFQPRQSRTSFDENVTDVNSSYYSEIFSPEAIFSSECGSEIPYSCPLPSLDDTDAMMSKIQDCLINDSSMELSSAVSQSSSCSDQKTSLRRSEEADHGRSDIKLIHSEFVDTCETMDDETTETGARKGRHPSPNRRFSFSLGRMGRSFSFKESSTVPQLSSTYVGPKSGPVISENTSCSDNPDIKKVKGHNRTRSSPLRRLIDPILKHKTPAPQVPIEGNLKSLSFWPTGLGSQEKKYATSTTQALLQFTIKNGFPLFKLLVDNNKNVLAATVKDLASSGKNGMDQNYTFYLVNEIKRKNVGWIRPGNRDKSYGYAYNVIGKMKVNSDLRCGEHKHGKHMSIESVLFGVEMKPADRGSAVIVKNRELAAVIFKIPIENLNHDGKSSDGVLVKENVKLFREDGGVVILPGAVHGSPNRGEPSPLINRWRSGGSCDCGGWDVGCKLRVLSIPNKLIISNSTPVSDHFELFVQGESKQNKPAFSLAPLKGGIFEVHFDSSISMLQAFFICVAFLSGQKLIDPSEVNKFATDESTRNPSSIGYNAVRGRAPASVRYTPNPPLSPVGRV